MNDTAYTPVYKFSNWAQHWFVGVAFAIFANILVVYLTRIYGQRLAIERTLKTLQRRSKQHAPPIPQQTHEREDSFFTIFNDDSDLQEEPEGNATTPIHMPGETPPPPPPPPMFTQKPEELQAKLNSMDWVKVFILGLLVQLFQFIALAIVSLALVTPITCLFFLWWRVATLETSRRKIRSEMSKPNRYSCLLYFASLRRAMSLRFIFLVVILCGATSAVIAGGPHEMYVVNVSKVIQLDAGLMIYISCIILIIAIQSCLNSSPWAMRELTNFMGLRHKTDLEPLLTGANAGLLGGQYFLMVKLLSEVAEAAFLLPEESASGSVIFIVIAIGTVVGGFHIHFWRRGMGLSRTNLFIPVYRFWFAISGMIASVLVLREFFDSNVSMIIVYFIGLFLDLIVMFMMARNALKAVKRDDFSTVIFSEPEPQVRFADQQQQTQSKRGVTNTLTLFSSSSRPALTRSKSDVTSGQFRARSNSLDSTTGNHLSSRRRRGSSTRRRPTPTHHDGGPNRRFSFNDRQGDSHLSRIDSFVTAISTPNNVKKNSSFFNEIDLDSDNGYESADSFHSEPSETRLHTFQKEFDYNLNYTSPTSMIVPQGQFNPWAPKGNSYYFDCASVPGVFKIRGPNYLEDGVKIKCDVSRMQLVMAEWLPNPEHPVKNICNDPTHFVQREHVGKSNRPFLFTLNLMVPSVGNAVFTWCRRRNLEPDPVFEKMLDEFMNHPDDDYRNARFKIVPSVPEGSFIVRKAVGGKPGLLCKPVPTQYFKGDNWYEVCVDVSASRVAFSVMGAVKGFASTLTLQLGFVLESKTSAELPERILGGVTIVRPQMTPAPQKRPEEEEVKNASSKDESNDKEQEEKPSPPIQALEQV